MISAMGTTTLLSLTAFKQLPAESGKLDLRRWHGPPPAWENCPSKPATSSAPEPGRSRTSASGGQQPDVSILHIDQPGSECFEGAPALAVEGVPESNTAQELRASSAQPKELQGEDRSRQRWH
jgi:hypothetical protein